MKVLYIYPHPDDESFGPAHVMNKQRRDGHEVYLLTLTRGGATKQRHRLGYAVNQMGDVRFEEMQNVARVLDLTGMTILDLPDSGLKVMDPRDIENVIREEIERVQPAVVVTYPVHGISGFHDHLITHAVVKRVYVELAERVPWLKRLAFVTLTEVHAMTSPHFRLSSSTAEEIDCVIDVEDVDIEQMKAALDCYVTFTETILKSGIKNMIENQSVFEIFGEEHDPPLDDLFSDLR